MRLSDVLEPVLRAEDADTEELNDAVGMVAEALAALGALLIGPSGNPVAGASDEMAVLGALNTYGQMLVREGRLEEALGVTELMDRIRELQASHRPRPDGNGD
ncbi:MAG TPA: hypothetical protein VK943_12165 [Arenibaculum sp.]|nr:hypothetical protein [Arenibaculum sp.]